MQTETKELNLFISSIEIASIVINEKPTDFDGARVRFEINTQTDIDLPSNLVRVNLQILVSDREKTNSQLAKFRVNYEFNISHLEQWIRDENNQMSLPKQLVYQLHGVSIATTRGVMLVALKGTHLEKTYMPIVDVTKLKDIASSNK